MASTSLIKALGLDKSSNALEAAPGTLYEASNVIIRRDDVIESRRGYDLYGTPFGSASDRCKQMAEYKGKILRHYSNKLEFQYELNNAGKMQFLPFSGNYSEAVSGRRFRSIESGGNFYFTSSEGIKKISAKTASDFSTSPDYITQAGGINAVDIEADLDLVQGQTGGYLPQDSVVAYKVVWGSKDINNVVTLGSPSDYVTVYNSLATSLILDFNKILNSLDNVKQTGSLIQDGNYSFSLALDASASSLQLKNNLVSLCKKIDQDIIYVDGVSGPLVIDSASIENGVVTINLYRAKVLSWTTVGAPVGFVRITVNSTSFISPSLSNTTVVLGNCALAGEYAAINFTATTFDIPYVGVVPVTGTGYAFKKGETVSDYFISGQSINISGIQSNTLNPKTIEEINKNQIIGNINQYSFSFTPNAYSSTTPVGLSGQGSTESVSFTEVPYNLVINSQNHGLKDGQSIFLINSNQNISTGAGVSNLDGTYNSITVLTDSSFSVTPNVTQQLNNFTVVLNSYTLTTPSAHNLLNNTPVNLSSTITLPTPLVANKVYYVKNSTPTTFELSEAIGGNSIQITAVGSGTHTAKKYFTISSGTVNWKSKLDVFSSSKIENYDFRAIKEPADPGIPATRSNLNSLQSYIESIISLLQTIKPNVVSSVLKEQYFNNLKTTQNSNVNLTINMPTTNATYGIKENIHFYQIYRSKIITTTSTDVLSTFPPNQEYVLIEENFPVYPDDFNKKYVSFLDDIPDVSTGVGGYLYTNERNGDGALQANEPPPFCTDLNLFKNYIFYSNTRLKHKKLINILGTQSMIDSYDAANPPQILFTKSSSITEVYTFVLGVQQQVKITCGPGSGLATTGAASYFTFNTPSKKFHVWYSPVGGTVTEPVVQNSTGIKVVIETTDTSQTVSQKTSNAIKSLCFDVSCSGRITNISSSVGPGSITITTSQPHGLTNDELITISGSRSTPSIDGVYTISNVTPSTFSISVNSSVVGINSPTSAGNYTPNLTNEIIITNFDYGLAPLPGIFAAGFSTPIAADVQGAGEDVNSKSVLLSNGGGSVSLAIEETAKSLIKVINRKSDFLNASYISSSTIGSILLQALDLSTDPFYILSNNKTTGESFNPYISPSLTINGVLTIPGARTRITTTTDHGLSLGDKVVILNKGTITPDISGLRTVVSVDPSFPNQFDIDFTYTSASVPYGKVSPAETAVFSENESQKHRVYYSKYQIAEAVPLLNYIDVGANDKEILRIFPLRDSLFIFKEDGLWRVSGESAPFTLSLFDSSCILLAPDSLDVSNNQLYCWTSQGISIVTEAGVNIISRPIDVDILKIATYPNFKNATWGVGYESDTSYTVYTTSDFFDTIATIGYRYSSLTSTWTTIDKSYVSGINLSTDDRLYLSPGDINYIEKERKDFSRYDYSDRELNYTILNGAYNSTNKTLVLPDVSDISEGDVLVQTQNLSVYEYNLLLQKLDFDTGTSGGYYSTLKAYAGDDLRSKLVALAAKLDLDLGTSDFSTSIAAHSGSISSISVSSPAIVTTTSNHNLLSTRYVQISGVSGLDKANGNFYITNLIPALGNENKFTIDIEAKTQGTGGTYTTLVESFEDIKSCYNIIVTLLNSNPTLIYSNYNLIDTTTVQEAIVINVNATLNKITVATALDYIVGPVSIFKSIPCSFVYNPNLMGDPLSYKHIREVTMMFMNKAFTTANLKFSSDLLPEFIEVPFNGDGSGIFGFGQFGSGFFGGASNSIPFRTYVPRQCQRCRYINIGFNHSIAREQFAIYGLTLTGESGISTRAYR